VLSYCYFLVTLKVCRCPGAGDGFLPFFRLVAVVLDLTRKARLVASKWTEEKLDNVGEGGTVIMDTPSPA